MHSETPPSDVPPIPAPDQRDDILDAPRLLSNLDGDRALMGDLIALFRKTSVGHVAAIHDALAKNDLGEIRGAAHAMKGAVGGLWGTATWELMAKIERAAREGDLPTVRALVPTMRPALDALLSRLDELYRFEQG